MSKYLKKFNTHQEYEAYITSESKILPNVSFCVYGEHVHYNPITVMVSGVTLNKTTLSLSQGASETLIATVLPSNASNKNVIWSSSNNNVATVNNMGLVTAVGSGNATITVTTVDGGYTAQCSVGVTVNVTSISLNKNVLNLDQGASETLVATVLPSNATNKNVTWTSSDSSIAAVDSNGRVTAIGVGDATVTVTTVDGGYTAQCNVSVAAVIVRVDGVTLNKNTLTLNIDESETLIATVTPNNATNKNVTWSSSDSSIATVDSNGRVTAIGVGDATVTVTTVDGSFTAQCATSVAVSVTGVTLNKSSLSLDQGASETLVATVLPSGATNKNVTWSSSNSSVATVDETGKVSGVSSGNAIITVGTVDGGFTAQCYASVQNVSYLITKYIVTSTTAPTIIGNSSSTSNFAEIEIDGIKLPNVVSAHTFTSLGEHNVRYKVVGTQIGDGALSGCSSLTSVEITDNVTSMGTYTFNGCSSLTSVTIGNSVTSIQRNAFYGCKRLTSIEIPNSVTDIGVNAFNGCSSLTSVTIPNSVTSIRQDAFYGCSSLTSVAIPNSVTSIERNVFYGCSGLTSVAIGNSVTRIGDWAFEYCRSLTSVTIPNSVTSIGDYVFAGCSSLTSVAIGNSVTRIGFGAFRDCSSLVSIISFATSAPSIDNTTFQTVKTSGTLTVPSGSSGYDTWMQNANYYLGLYGWTKVEQ